MCTVVFIPQKNKIIFASLRDESPVRPTAISPLVYTLDSVTILAPKDTLAGGTWLGINDQDNVIILLNGGFIKHKHTEPYKRSRGLIVNELLNSGSPLAEWGLLDLENIEPFTLLIWSAGKLFQTVWDGSNKHTIELAASKPLMLSSSTLYPEMAKENRTHLFNNWMETEPVVSMNSLLDFFKSYSESENGFIMNMNEKFKTLSYSFIELNSNSGAELNYYDLQSNVTSKKSIHMKSNVNQQWV
jgi:uncharacterized protein with NRDE domain